MQQKKSLTLSIISKEAEKQVLWLLNKSKYNLKGGDMSLKLNQVAGKINQNIGELL